MPLAAAASPVAQPPLGSSWYGDSAPGRCFSKGCSRGSAARLQRRASLGANRPLGLAGMPSRMTAWRYLGEHGRQGRVRSRQAQMSAVGSWSATGHSLCRHARELVCLDFRRRRHYVALVKSLLPNASRLHAHVLAGGGSGGSAARRRSRELGGHHAWREKFDCGFRVAAASCRLQSRCA